MEGNQKKEQKVVCFSRREKGIKGEKRGGKRKTRTQGRISPLGGLQLGEGKRRKKRGEGLEPKELVCIEKGRGGKKELGKPSYHESEWKGRKKKGGEERTLPRAFVFFGPRRQRLGKKKEGASPFALAGPEIPKKKKKRRRKEKRESSPTKVHQFRGERGKGKVKKKGEKRGKRGRDRKEQHPCILKLNFFGKEGRGKKVRKKKKGEGKTASFSHVHTSAGRKLKGGEWPACQLSPPVRPEKKKFEKKGKRKRNKWTIPRIGGKKKEWGGKKKKKERGKEKCTAFAILGRLGIISGKGRRGGNKSCGKGGERGRGGHRGLCAILSSSKGRGEKKKSEKGGNTQNTYILLMPDREEGEKKPKEKGKMTEIVTFTLPPEGGRKKREVVREKRGGKEIPVQ